MRKFGFEPLPPPNISREESREILKVSKTRSENEIMIKAAIALKRFLFAATTGASRRSPCLFSRKPNNLVLQELRDSDHEGKDHSQIVSATVG
jgi:hypothetical protein